MSYALWPYDIMTLSNRKLITFDKVLLLLVRTFFAETQLKILVDPEVHPYKSQIYLKIESFKWTKMEFIRSLIEVFKRTWAVSKLRLGDFCYGFVCKNHLSFVLHCAMNKKGYIVFTKFGLVLAKLGG